MASDEGIFPELYELHERHPGLTSEIARYYAQAACVCLTQHHQPPVTMLVSAVGAQERRYRAQWPLPMRQDLNAWANIQDAVRDGAYSVVLAALEVHLGLLAIRRSEVGTGTDYYVGTPGSFRNPVDGELDLEQALRLEVSGIGLCTSDAPIRRRLVEKVAQARRGKSNLPALAGVVGFSRLTVVFQMVT